MSIFRPDTKISHDFSKMKLPDCLKILIYLLLFVLLLTFLQFVKFRFANSSPKIITDDYSNDGGCKILKALFTNKFFSSRRSLSFVEAFAERIKGSV